ncbi:hypothetical protein V6K52_15830 [Knoellia sp. S7-12]|uniref:HAAS signaling domain-containing protein n=1 Tax=Knoellia sp. S7-12 TaxID=3126698 RepID=UPI0033679A66
MNASMNDTDTEVRDYVAQVRAALADLPAEDADEFTTGMEADLTERLAEPGDGTLRDRLGEPDAYAAELRSAAGLPPRVVAVQTSTSAGERLSQWWSELATNATTAMPWLSDLRPVWWAVRGFALAALPALMIGAPITWLGVLSAVVSIALGLMARHGTLTGDWVGPVRVIGNIVAVLLLPFALVLFVDRGSYSEPTYTEEMGSPVGTGVFNNGQPVANLYAYDETGRRIDKVRILDQNGRALQVGEDFISAGDDLAALEQLRDPSTGELPVARDIFPLRWNDRSGWERMGDTEWEPPVAITPLPGPVPTIEPKDPTTTSPTTAATVSPSPTASPEAPPTSPSSGVSATPTPTPSSSPSPSASR